jgi:hypothetical protein
VKGRDAWIYAVIGGLLIWWWFGRRNEVSIGAGVRIGGWVPVLEGPPQAPPAWAVPGMGYFE